MSDEKKDIAAAKPPIYLANSHTVQMRLIPEGEAPDSEEWRQLDIQSDEKDPRSALIGYLHETFGDPEVIKESKDGIFSVRDEMAPDAVFVRFYQLR